MGYLRLMENNTAMNLYILEDVLYDYTAGMAVIAASSKERACELFIEEFGEEHTDELKSAGITEIKGIADPTVEEGLVRYVYGGS